MSNSIEDHILKRFKILNKLGKGAYGIVWKAIDKTTGETVALKKIFDAFRNSTDSQRTYREIMFLTELRGRPGIIGLKCVLPAYNNKDVYLVFEHMETDLHTVIRSDILQDVHKRYITFQLLQILHMIHSGDLLHRDLKPSNILLNSDCSIKLADFGLARSLKTFNDKSPLLTDYVATRWYRAPEILIGSNKYTKAVDMWAVGCIVAELLCGKPLFPGSSTMNQICKVLAFTGIPSDEDIKSLDSQFSSMMFANVKHIKKMEFEHFFTKQVPQNAKDLIYKLLEFNPEKRIGTLDALNHPYVVSFNMGKYKLTTLPGPVHIPTNDNIKYSVDNYRNLVKEYINSQNFLIADTHEDGPTKSHLFNKFRKSYSILQKGCVGKKKNVDEFSSSNSSSPDSNQQYMTSQQTITSNAFSSDTDANATANINEKRDSTRLVAAGTSNEENNYDTSEYSELFVSGDSPTRLKSKQNLSDSVNVSSDSNYHNSKNMSPTETTQDIFARFKLHGVNPNQVKGLKRSQDKVTCTSVIANSNYSELDDKNVNLNSNYSLSGTSSDSNAGAISNMICVNGKYYVKHHPLQYNQTRI
ncbi:Extracellular signal-regulated kinase 2 [Babesia microti strain RI]|uniref:Mitogen-activated protein kinase n=1 Tax=Babesia microti (strain RI) TaxID=1133968 RepID=A0A1R4AC22_BABMR|nr:Extracellular signal-regulated kinase 2 [Babesia microti strain RI]SJK86571.1 Extracellular signal-regulated kinase 2 [Babesia microti strain RI]|eukprot:XP_021338713.1 Extracellular signal-regulated kinase 2 [Babesia microti strain RI]